VVIVTSDTTSTEQPAPQILALPAIPVSAGALIFDKAGRLLILTPNRQATLPARHGRRGKFAPLTARHHEVTPFTGLGVPRVEASIQLPNDLRLAGGYPAVTRWSWPGRPAGRG
jgi:hypothetical protein